MHVLRWLLCVALLAALPAGAEEPPLELTPGSQRVIDVPGLRRVAVANPEVADVKVVNANQLLVIAQRRGRTSLTLWTSQGAVQRTLVVEPPQAEELALELKALGFSSLEVRTIGDHVVIDGTVDSFGDLQRLRRLVDGRSDVKLLVRADSRVIQASLAALAEQINAALKKHGLTTAHAVVVGQRIHLEGSVADEAERDKAQRIADALYLEFQASLPAR